MNGSAYDRFLASMRIDRERWHDGVGYDLTAFDAMSGSEKSRVEALLLARDPPDWRDLQALAKLDSPAGRQALRAGLRHANPAVRGAALRHGGELLTDGERLLAIRRALQEATFYNGLTEALEAIETFHPPEVTDLLLRALVTREAEVAVHLAGLAAFLHGLSSEPFDFSQRSFFLRFAEDDPVQRAEAFRELCGRIGRDPEPFLSQERDRPDGR